MVGRSLYGRICPSFHSLYSSAFCRSLSFRPFLVFGLLTFSPGEHNRRFVQRLSVLMPLMWSICQESSGMIPP